ncbi:MAG: hypothetical protein ACLS61_11175 [Ruminococcus sp.]
MNAQAIKGVYYQKLTVKGASDAELNDEGTAAQADGDETTEVMTGKTFYFNPHFAKSVEAADRAPNNISAIYLRTPRQLYHMSLYYQDYASLLKGISFIQERDIDYAPYDWKNYEGVREAVTVQSPVGVAEDGTITPFTSTYKGGGYEIPWNQLCRKRYSSWIYWRKSVDPYRMFSLCLIGRITILQEPQR